MKKVYAIFVLALALIIAPALASTLTIGDRVPDFTLTNQDGGKTSLSDFKGKGVVVSFLYTQCPLPNKCPMIKKKLMGLAEVAQKMDDKTPIQVMAITIDPKNDTPEVLKAYAQGFDEKYDNWTFLTGAESDIASVAAAFGVIYWDENGVVEHNMKTVFIDAEQTVRIVKSGSDWKAGEFAAEIKEMQK